MSVTLSPIPTFSDLRPASLKCGEKSLDFLRPRVMGILNITPDSFYDGNLYNTADKALKRAAEMILEGADIIDLGAESSRPRAKSISDQEELDRLIPILQAIRERFDIIISVDTQKSVVMREAIKGGAHIINDITALADQDALQIIAQSNVAVCLMHMAGTPTTMQNNPHYSDVVAEVTRFLESRVTLCRKAGIARDRLVIDPGFGFGKTTDHNMHLLRNLSQFKTMGLPVLVGLSRKFSIGEILKVPAEQRLYGSIAANVIAMCQGASILRVHDIKPTVDALKIAAAVLAQG